LALAQLFERSKQRKRPSAAPLPQSGMQDQEANVQGDEADPDSDEQEVDEVPDDLKGLSPEEQQRRILRRAMYMMGIGSILVVLFSDPLVDVLAELGALMNISPFYVSFVLAPLASNLTELIASYSYAKKKTNKSITICFATLFGGCILNNVRYLSAVLFLELPADTSRGGQTFVLGIFLSLVYFRNLEWSYSAETISIIVAEVLVAIIAFQKVQTVFLGCLALSVFPFTLFLVAMLENVAGLD